MKLFRSISIMGAMAAAALMPSPMGAESRFGVEQGHFALDGKPYVIKAAELHYPRIPEPYWEHRIRMSKALGMNTICLYVFWNIHEQQPDQFDFTGQNDLRRFVELCRDNGMNVILRPGPYVCAEWEMGGLPWWLLQKEDIRLRDDDPYFLERVDKFQQKVAEQVADLTADKGGPILMIQVENEYGSYATDKEYMGKIRDIVKKNFGDDVTLFQCDWSSNFLDNGLDDLVWTLNFGTGADIDSQFAPLKAARPDAPLMCSEFWSGWFDKWGADHETRPADDMVAGIDEMLSKDISFSLYMTHGGTNWGHWAGANSPGFAPDVTSYDYDAPIDESGNATPKYHLLRAAMGRHADGTELPAIPAPIDTMSIPRFTLTDFAPLTQNLPTPMPDSRPRPMEEYGQGYGSILYSTTLPATEAGDTLVVTGLHDFGQIFADGRLLATIDRRVNDPETVILPALPAGTRLDILVEGMGRINFGRAITDRKGVTGDVELRRKEGGTAPLSDQWSVYPLPDEYDFYALMDYQALPEAEAGKGRVEGKGNPDDSGRMPRGVYRGTFTLTDTADTFLDFSTWGKGLVYVNGHPLGRIWHIGPQQTLYMPECWLKKGENEILVFDLLGPERAETEGHTRPILDRLSLPQADLPDSEAAPDFTAGKVLLESAFGDGNGWKEFFFGQSEPVRRVGIEILSTIDANPEAAIAEFYLLDGESRRIPRENWRVTYVSSQDAAGGNHTAEKSFDLQESTYWQTAPGATLPQRMVIDLGGDYQIGGIQYLPRVEYGAPGAVRDFRLLGW